MRGGEGDIQRYIEQRRGIVTPGERDRQIDTIRRYRDAPTDPGNPFSRPVQLPPGFFAADTTSVTALPTNRTVARYLGQSPDDINLVTLRFNVTTAASGITWAEAGIATSLDMTFGGPDLSLAGYVAGGSIFNSTGIVDIEVPVNISHDAHVWAVFGSNATTPFQVSRGIGDALTTGMIAFADTTRPSTMADPTTFTASAATANAAWIAFMW